MLGVLLPSASVTRLIISSFAVLKGIEVIAVYVWSV
jgi:hypothetical protein